MNSDDKRPHESLIVKYVMIRHRAPLSLPLCLSALCLSLPQAGSVWRVVVRESAMAYGMGMGVRRVAHASMPCRFS